MSSPALGLPLIHCLKPLHKIITALRSQDLGLLSRYDDLYIKAFTELKNDDFMGRIESIRVQLAAAQDNQLGITPSAKTIPYRPTESKLSTGELLTKVMEDSTTLPDALN
jgi:hypothetical protein